MNILTKLKHKWRGEQCPKCKSYRIVKGNGWANLMCLKCDHTYELRGLNDEPVAPQVEGKNTIYEDYLINKRFD